MNRWNHRKTGATFLVLVWVTFTLTTPLAQAATFQLPAGTEVKVRFNPDTKISSGDLEVGAKLALSLAEPIMVGDVLLVAAGAAGSAVVSEVEKASAPGKPGKIVVEFVDLGTRGGYRTVDGAPLKLGGKIEQAGKGKKLLAYVTIVGILLIKGGQGEVPTDGTYTATIAETVVLQSD